MNVGDRIKTLRLENSYTQAELAGRLGVSAVTVMKYEKGIIGNIKASTIKKMAEIFDVSPIYLMGMTDKRKEPKWDERDEKFVEDYKELDDSERKLLQMMLDNMKSKRE